MSYVSEFYLIELLISSHFFRIIYNIRMTRHSRKRERSPSPPKPSNKRRRISPSIKDTSRHTRSSKIRPVSPYKRSPCKHKRTNRRSRTPSPPPRVRVPTFTATSRRISPVRPTVRSTIHRPSPIRVPRQLSPIVVRRQLSPIRPPPIKVSNRQLGKQMKAQRRIGSIKNPPKQEGKIHVLRLDGVSNNIVLSRLIHEFVVEASSIIGCHRVADYDAQINDSIVFLYMTNEKEFNDFVSRDFFIIDGCIIAVTDPHLIYGQAKYTIPFATASNHDMRMSPHPIGLFGFRQLPTTTTFYVIAVLKELEQEGTVTGFKLAFCERRQLTRNFGFATFLSRVNAFKVCGKQLNIVGDVVEVKLPTGMPFLVSEDRKHLVANHKCEFSEEIRAANWLNVNFVDATVPVRPLPFGEVFNPPPSNPSIQPQQKPQAKPRRMASDTPAVIRHDTPPASPTLSIGDDYEIDENGILAIPSTFWLDAGAD